jgi:hypothetical protein
VFCASNNGISGGSDFLTLGDYGLKFGEGESGVLLQVVTSSGERV